MTDGRKNDDGKLRYELLPMAPVDEIVRVLGFGAAKYDDDNWRRVPDAENRYYAAAMRHLSAWRQGENIDPESGRSHLAHAACCLVFLMELHE
jgi:hypothetical protein